MHQTVPTMMGRDRGGSQPRRHRRWSANLLRPFPWRWRRAHLGFRLVRHRLRRQLRCLRQVAVSCNRSTAAPCTRRQALQNSLVYRICFGPSFFPVRKAPRADLSPSHPTEHGCQPLPARGVPLYPNGARARLNSSILSRLARRFRGGTWRTASDRAASAARVCRVVVCRPKRRHAWRLAGRVSEGGSLFVCGTRGRRAQGARA